MERLSEAMLQMTKLLPEGAPVTAKMLMHLGTRPAINRALLRLAQSGKLLKAGRGIYLAPVDSRFGMHPPLVERMIEQFAFQRGETIVPSGATSANGLGLTTQVPVHVVYWTSGRSRMLYLGKQTVELKHVPPWKLALASEPAGEIVRALAWAGPKRVQLVLGEIQMKVPRTEILKVAQQIARLPNWMAKALAILS